MITAVCSQELAQVLHAVRLIAEDVCNQQHTRWDGFLPNNSGVVTEAEARLCLYVPRKTASFLLRKYPPQFHAHERLFGSVPRVEQMVSASSA